MRLRMRFGVIAVAIISLLVPTYSAHAKKKATTLSIDLEHDTDIRQLRERKLTKLLAKKQLSTKTISSADFNQLVKYATDFVNATKMKSHVKDRDLEADHDGKSHVTLTVTLNGKKKKVTFESDAGEGSVTNAPAPFREIAEMLRDLAP